MYKKVECNLGGKRLSIETGKLAKQTDGAVYISFGDSRILVTALSNKEASEGLDFFPLTCDYVEKYYSSGKIPGGYLKREAKPSDFATLTSRLIDRPLRPLFPEDFKFETQIVATVLSYDNDHTPDQLAIIGASAALMISNIPFMGPLAACSVAKVEGKLIASPSALERENSTIDLFVASTQDAVVMVEGSAKSVPDEEILEAIMFAKDAVKDVLKAQKELFDFIKPTKRQGIKPLKDINLENLIKEYTNDNFSSAFSIKEKLARYKALDELKKHIKTKILETYLNTYKDNFISIYKGKEELLLFSCNEIFENLKYEFARNLVTEKNTRIDNRAFNEVRPINNELGFLPRAHGSCVFTRGETQVLAVATLGSTEDQQYVDSLEGLKRDPFMLHYNFPQYSVGEIGFLRGPGRREIGHGNLAKRGLIGILPNAKDFPYTIRIVSEVLESNGSSSMGTVCSSCLALMDAGVPIIEPISGVAMGLIYENQKAYILTDILGDEDHLGDMDFKVVGTKNTVTAIQMDIKIQGVSKEILALALEQAKTARIHILNEMAKTLDKPRAELSAYAPKYAKMNINPDKIREVIGQGGKTIKSIQEKTAAKIDISDDGTINLFCQNNEKLEETKEMINLIIGNIKEGTRFNATVKNITDFGAFVEYIPGREGLVHISEIDSKRVENVNDYFKLGQEITVVYLGSDNAGRVKLSYKAAKD